MSKRSKPSGIEVFRRWQSGETDKQIAAGYGWGASGWQRVRGIRRRWAEQHPDEAAKIIAQIGERPEPKQAPKPDKIDTDGADKSTFTTDGNTATLDYRGRITGLADLIERCKIDLEAWRIDRHIINTWEVGAKVEEKDLTWRDGVIVEGMVVSPSRLTIETLYQVKAWLVKRHPEPILWPAIQAANVQLETPPAVKRPERSHRRALFFGDAHTGYLRDVDTGRLEPMHDRAALDVVMQIAADAQPDEIHDLGDGSDLAEWSNKYITSPEMHFTTQPMILERAWWYGDLRRHAPGAAVLVHEGNHDRRIEDALAANLVAGCRLKAADMVDDYPVMSLPFLLGLRRMGVEWLGGYPDDVAWLNEGLCAYHGDIARQGSGDTVKAILRDTKYSQVVGHIHRSELGMASRTDTAQGGISSVRTMSPGCLCRLDGAVPAARKWNNWQQGCAVIDYNPAGSEFDVTFVAIENGRAMFRGQVYEARDRLEQLRDETKYAF